jgi:hypothetical protein
MNVERICCNHSAFANMYISNLTIKSFKNQLILPGIGVMGKMVSVLILTLIINMFFQLIATI